MLTKSRLEFILRLTDWFHGHWEDPEWGKRASTQVLVAVAVRDLASAINDIELRNAIQDATDKVVARGSQGLMKG